MMREYTREEKIKAAYALNLCTVSVSQIIDYDDINILEQEYDIILNNLNLQEMPPDEALLHILKQLLDTITFFRIQEGDKKIVDMEYQQKVKNAFWDAAPDFGLIVAGGNPVTMAVSLASQVGIGYMNYRRNMAEYELDHEKALWKLQRSAMEQFNGLRRELFDTAWRLAKEYQFEDRYRLTERQIHQYNDILMDNEDLIRKYERMNAIKNNFDAYPPFWYYFGNTAALIALKKNLSEDSRKEYRESAKKYFENYRAANKECKLLREDHVAATCAIEYAALLDLKNDKQRIQDLMKEAITSSCGSKDIMQLGICTLLSIGATEEAEQYLKILVNENYNKILNGQILSRILAAKYKDEKRTEDVRKKAAVDYELLTTRINPVFLYGLPDKSTSDSEKEDVEFRLKQKFVVKTRYYRVLKEYFKLFRNRFEKALPYSYKEGQTVMLFDCGESPEEINRKIKEAEKNFYSDLDAMTDTLYYANIIETYFRTFNDMLNGLYSFDFINNKDELTDSLTDRIMEKKERLLFLNSRLIERTFNIDNYRELAGYSFSVFADAFIRNFYRSVFNYIDSQETMTELSVTESELTRFCIKYELENPEKPFEDAGQEDQLSKDETYLSIELLGKSIEESKKNKELEKKLVNCIRENIDSCFKGNNTKKVDVIFRDDPRFSRTLRRARIYNSNYKRDGLVYIDDKTITDSDLLLTKYGVYPVWHGIRWKFAPYRDIVVTDDGYLQFYGKILFDKLKCDNWNTDALINLFRKLDDLTGSRYKEVDSLGTTEAICDGIYKEQVLKQKLPDYSARVSIQIETSGSAPEIINGEKGEKSEKKAQQNTFDIKKLEDPTYLNNIDNLAKEGNKEAQYILGAYYYTGHFGKSSICLSLGKEYLQKSAKQGCGKAIDAQQLIRKMEASNKDKIEEILRRRLPIIAKNRGNVYFDTDQKDSSDYKKLLDKIYDNWLGTRGKPIIAFVNATFFKRNSGKDGLLFTPDSVGIMYASKGISIPYAEIEVELVKKELKFKYGKVYDYDYNLSELKICLEEIKQLFDYNNCFDMTEYGQHDYRQHQNKEAFKGVNDTKIPENREKSLPFTKRDANAKINRIKNI